jgi:hypothetical protein
MIVTLFDHGRVASTASGEYPGKAPALVDFGPHGPTYVRHATIPGTGWLVWQILEAWHSSPRDPVRQASETDRYRLDVSGPAPWDRSPDTRFTLVVRRYARPCTGWWISAEYPPPEPHGRPGGPGQAP